MVIIVVVHTYPLACICGQQEQEPCFTEFSTFVKIIPRRTNVIV